MRVTPLILGSFLSIAAAAQDTPPAVQTAPAPPVPIVLANDGKPMVLPFRCSEDDIHWGGLTCTEEEPCPIFLELAGAEQSGSRVVTAGNIHTESVTLYSVLLTSEDGGKNWSEAHERIRGSGLDRIQFFDAEHGWVLGQELSPIPQNPFLLITGNGGKTWQQRFIFNESSENRFGAIQQFSLSGKDASLVIDRGRGSSEDRYVLFESPDAGDTWSLKQESAKALVLKNVLPPSGDWRIRTDAPTKSFHVEHRVAGRWNSLGAFSVKLDPCKPPEGGGQ
jgi:hypothetical protein